MEIFPPGPGEPSIHSYDPGIHPYPDGLVWITPLAPHQVAVDMGRALARMHFRKVAVRDWTTVANSLRNGDAVPAAIALDVRWGGVLRRVEVADEEDDFAGLFLEDEATVSCAVRQDGFAFVSDRAETSVTHFAEIGEERNGVFFA